MSKTSRTKLSVFLAAGIAAVILAAALSVFYGSTKIPFETVLQALRAPDMTDQQQIIIHELRIPRTIGCILVGAAFAVAGAIMQGVTRNPLADSGLLGIGGKPMDELNPTIKERQIYHEMKLTPAMVKSIRTLCGVCLRHYVETKAFKIAIVPNKDRCMETCTVCQTRRGYDYVVMPR